MYKITFSVVYLIMVFFADIESLITNADCYSLCTSHVAYLRNSCVYPSSYKWQLIVPYRLLLRHSVWRVFFQLPTPPIHLTELHFNGIESSTMALKFAAFFNLLVCFQNARHWYRCIPSCSFLVLFTNWWDWILFGALVTAVKMFHVWPLYFTNSNVPTAAAFWCIVNQVPTCMPSESSDRVRCWMKRKFCCWHGEGKIIWLPHFALKNRCTWNDKMFCLPPVHILHLLEAVHNNRRRTKLVTMYVVSWLEMFHCGRILL